MHREIDFCKYHPLQPATGYCTSCQIFYGDCCVSITEDTGTACQLCNNRIKSLGAVNSAQPFWAELGNIFSYPFQGVPLLLIVLVAAGLNYAGRDNGLLTICLVLMLVKYGFSIVDSSLNGQSSPPSIADAFSFNHFSLVFKQLMTLLMFGISFFWLSTLQSVFVQQVLTLGLAILMPASTIVLVKEKRLISAINISRLTVLATSIGLPYLLLVGFLYLIAIGATTAIEFFYQKDFFYLLSGVSIGYLYLVFFRLLGYAGFQYQNEIGYIASEQQLNTPSENEMIENKIGIFVIEGRINDAKTLILEQLKKDREGLIFNERYHRILKISKDMTGLASHTGFYIGLLLKNGRETQAVNLFLDYLRWIKAQGKQHELILENLSLDYDTTMLLAKLLSQSHHPKAAIILLTQRWDHIVDIDERNEMKFLAATLYAEGLHQDKTAISMLESLISQTPQSSIETEARRYLKLLKKLDSPS